jgi:hypothetical protein
MDDEVLVEPGNPFDFERADLDELAEALAKATEAPARVVVRDEIGYGVTGGEVLHVWLPDTDVILNVAILVAHLKDWAKDRWRREREEHPADPARSHYVDLLGPDGRAISRIEVDDSVGRVVELPVKDHPPRRRPD